MKYILYITTLMFLVSSCHSQTEKSVNKIVGGPCEGCEAIYEYGNKKLTSIDTLPTFKNGVPKLKITGTVYENDKKTPADGVILYIYHTNRQGIYENNGNENGWARLHGFLRGWIKTDKDGKYTFYTVRPASYPNRQEPEHIHITVKEPDKNEYYIDAIVFDDDPLLTKSKRQSLPNRGGSGIVIPSTKNNMLTVERDITLGLNIQNHN